MNDDDGGRKWWLKLEQQLTEEFGERERETCGGSLLAMLTVDWREACLAIDGQATMQRQTVDG